MQIEYQSGTSDGPLTGIKVLDFTSVVVGPVATQCLADYGADVIKIEAPDGDILRRMGGASQSGQLSPKFIQMNHSKRSLAIDLKTQAGRDVVHKMMETADVVVVNMRSAALVKLGLTWLDIQAINPKIVHCWMMGFGSDGRYFDKPAYDTIIQGSAGISACFDRRSGHPEFVPLVLADHLVALIAVQMILLGLRARDLTGEGQSVEVPMFENISSFVLQEHLGQKAFEPSRGEAGDARILDKYARPAKTKDGYICVSANTDRQVHAFFKAVGRPELITDPKFATIAARSQNVSEFYRIRSETLATKTNAEWMESFDMMEIPAMPFNTLDELIDNPHLNDVGLFQSLKYEQEGWVKHMRPACKFTGGQRRQPIPAPKMGEHNVELLEELGFTKEDITKLKEAHIIVNGQNKIREKSVS